MDEAQETLSTHFNILASVLWQSWYFCILYSTYPWATCKLLDPTLTAAAAQAILDDMRQVWVFYHAAGDHLS